MYGITTATFGSQSHLEAAPQTTEFMLRLLEIEHKMFASNQELIVEKYKPARQQTNRKEGRAGFNNTFRGPNPSKNQQKPNRQQQYQPNFPRWNFFGPPSMPSFAPPGWGYQPNF